MIKTPEEVLKGAQELYENTTDDKLKTELSLLTSSINAEYSAAYNHIKELEQKAEKLEQTNRMYADANAQLFAQIPSTPSKEQNYSSSYDTLPSADDFITKFYGGK